MSIKKLKLRLDSAEKELAEIRKDLAAMRGENTCVVNGTLYKGVPNDRDCTGCAGESDDALCAALADCVIPDRVIWIRVQ